MKTKKYIKHENKYIEWLENNFNSHNLFYFEEDPNVDNNILCKNKETDKVFATFYKNIIDKILGEENIPNQ